MNVCGYIAMGSTVLFIFRSRLLVYSAGSGVNRMQVERGPLFNSHFSRIGRINSRSNV